MSSFNEKYGPWAIVAGAAEGLGEAYSTALAGRKINLVMVDHQPTTMKILAEKLKQEFGIETVQFNCDLADKEAAAQILKQAENLEVGLLVYNAAFSPIKSFIQYSTEEIDTFIEVNARTQIQLVHAFSKKLIAEKKSGGILLMSSLAGLIGMQLVAPYAATKAFAWNLAEALNHELKLYNIDVMACLAGVTDTPAYRKSNPKLGFIKPAIMSPIDVAEGALKNLGKKARYIPGFSNRLNYFILTRLMPRKMASLIANKTMGKMYGLRR